MKKFLLIGVLLALPALAAGSFLKSAAFRALEPEARQAITLVAKSREARPRLARYPGWTAGAEREDGEVWHVWFEREDEWLGEAYVDLGAGRVREVYIPVDPTPAERARILPRLRKLLAADAEVRALLGGAGDWDEEVVYDKWDDVWYVYYWRGEDALGVRVERDGGRFRVDRTFDPLALEAEQARRHAQDRAIQLAYADEAVGRALEPLDGWKAYAEPAGPGLARWTVSFATPDRVVVSVWLDLESEEVLALETP